MESHTDPEDCHVPEEVESAERTDREYIPCWKVTERAMQNGETPQPWAKLSRISEFCTPQENKNKEKRLIHRHTERRPENPWLSGAYRETTGQKLRAWVELFLPLLPTSRVVSPHDQAPCISSAASPHREGCAVPF